MSTPFARSETRIPVTLVTAGTLPPGGDTVAVLTLAPHTHDGTTCVACASGDDIRAKLFDLLTEARQGLRPPLTGVVIDARAVDPRPVLDRLDPTAPALALRDHTVVRSFHLSAVV